MSAIISTTTSNDSVSAGDGERITEPRPEVHDLQAAAPADEDHVTRNSIESDDAVSVPLAMSKNVRRNDDTHRSSLHTVSDELNTLPPKKISSYPQPKSSTTPIREPSPQSAAHQTTGVTLGGDQGNNPPAPTEQGLVGNEGKTGRHEDHTCGCQSQNLKLTGWAAVEKTLTNFDQQEVGGYKEDIDSLLTFAGLYSGVLTAFVIVSFVQLQEDTAAESLRVLRVIANQTVVNAVSATPSPINPPPFQPSLAAKRVNVLWFASLVISLSTASLSILVKQWLRSYMAFASSSPQGALRIRHFRRAGLQTWRVFGIASMLPLLLQVSLALFFIGLCFFTADVDPIIGNTTLPLVCAWAFLFTATTLSPIFSANCPYKTPALSAATTILRVHVVRTSRAHVVSWARWGRCAVPILFWKAHIFLAYLLLSVFLLPLRGLRGVLRRISFQWARSLSMFITLLGDAGPPMVLPTILAAEPHPEEADVRTYEAQDMDILIKADTIQANTELEMTMVEDALNQSNPDRRQAFDFLVQIIGNRMPLPVDLLHLINPPTALLNCSSLSTGTKDNILVILQRYVIDNTQVPASASVTVAEEWQQRCASDSDAELLLLWAIGIRMSMRKPNDQLPEGALELLSQRSRILEARHPYYDRESSLNEMVFVACCRISHDHTLAGLVYKIKSSFDVFSYLKTREYNQTTDRGDATVSLSSSVEDTAAVLVSDLVDATRNLPLAPRNRLVGSPALVILLCQVAERYRLHNNISNRAEIRYEDVLSPFVEEAFQQRSGPAIWAILEPFMPVSGYNRRIRTITQDDFDLTRYHTFLVETGEKAYGLVDAVLQVTAIPCNSHEQIIDRLRLITTVLELTTPQSRSRDRRLWRRVFHILTLHLRSLAYLSMSQDSLSALLRVHRSPSQYYVSWLDKSGGTKIDKIFASHSEDDLSRFPHRRNSIIPDYFCLMLGWQSELPLPNYSPPDGKKWSAKHLQNISAEEQGRIVDEGESEMEAIYIDINDIIQTQQA